ncbi:aldehyde dehydrogenase family protein [Kitasatospora sp. NPDC059146]|uniref:aldehyde dehydrogenase family protein n=1 Tax=Kitasatospora sp. NPDC059146 TaxID=3346741 RepID=UPI003694E275
MTPTTTRWSSGRAEDRFTVEDPATGDVITTVQGGGVPETDAAVRAAHRAFTQDWRWRPAAERAALLLRGADVLEAHADELAELVSRENGKPVADARLHDVGFLVGVFRFFGSLADKLPGEFYESGPVYTSTVREPLGVVAGIIPFNWPPIHTGGKIAPALAAGNTVVLKPGEQAPLTVLRIVELLNTVLPADVLHVVPGTGPVAGRALVAHPLVRMVSFTGSTTTGRAVAHAAAERLAPTLLELGGKNAFLVLADADLDLAARDALDGAFYNKGEACTAASRILVHRDVHDVFVERLATGVRALRTGHGADPATHVGPLVSRAQQQRVLDRLRLGLAEGATIAAQGDLPADPALERGFFVPPTLFTAVTRTMRIATEEVFGPVATVTVFASEDEAVEIANESDYGLLAGVYSRDSATAFRVARRLEVGMVLVNNYFRGLLGTPFGGTKHSGYGREHAIDTLREFTYQKSVRFPTGLATVPTWRAVTEVHG